MSRCFPYPPPGYTPSRAMNEALIDSIKLQKEKKEKEQKTDPNSDHVKGHIGQKTWLDCKNELFIQKRREAESVHGRLPVPSTENSNKRKRHSDDTPVHGNLIRLPSKTKTEFCFSANGLRPCSISRQTQHRDGTSLRDRTKTSSIEQGLNLRNNRKGIGSGSVQDNHTFTPQVELQFKDLIDKLSLPRIQDASLYPVDSDWLLQKRRLQGDGCRSSGLWPRAEYLDEIDACALPFVVPY